MRRDRQYLNLLLDRLSHNQGIRLPQRSQQPSAVLVPIIDEPEPRVLFTLRADHLKHHGGQFSFPGGRIERDEEALETAFRESKEEIGLERVGVKIIGRLDDVYSPRGFHIQCFVGLVQPFQPVLNLAEVTRIMGVRLSEVADKARHESKPWPADRRHEVHYFHFDEGTVWGVTGLMTLNLRRLLTKT